MDQKKVIVCGTTFGQIYLEAIKGNPDLELAGIMAQNSERSNLTAEKYHVPLFQSIEELPEDIDMAFVVIRSSCLGGPGTEIAKRLLEKGIHVLQEHPVHYKDIEDLAKIANRQKKVYLVGNLYKHMEQVKNFILCARELNEKNELLYMRAAFSSQVSYPAMDILLEALPAGVGLTLENQMECGGFQILTGKMKGVPFTFEIHHEVNPKDPNNNMNFMHEIEFLYAAGRLLLSNTFGPLLWYPKMNTDIPHAIDRNYPPYMLENSGICLGSMGCERFQDVLETIWPIAVGQDVKLMEQTVENRVVMGKSLQKEMAVAKLWNQITSEIGYAQIVDRTVFAPLPVDILKGVMKKETTSCM
ncbi:MAG: Gfo/Idh/MocA family oxidoreductase [Lachnospiraceae bacterium]|nr:Gfo/Idh/MocA family oxidoreductase [Lachnospiraceae bacterium]